MLIVDASVLAPVVADAGPDGTRFRARVRGEQLAGPDLLRIEVVSVLRRHVAAGMLGVPDADAAVIDLLDLPIRVFPTASLLARAWELRDNLTVYDALYVSLAEAAGATLLTADGRLARAPGPRCAIETL